MKDINSIPSDIDSLFENGVDINEDNLKAFLGNVEALLRRRLNKNKEERTTETLRMSKLGIPNRKLWFEHHHQDNKQDTGKLSNALKFIYGDLVEQLLLYLLKEAGHTVEHEQREVVIDGVVGHQDARIDNYTVDIKTTSSFAFKKFLTGQLYKDDPFGYIAQLSSYMYADQNTNGAFLAVNKESGQITVLKLDQIDTIDPPARIKEIREVLAKDTAPEEKCYQPKEIGTSGNLELATSCTYCPFKDQCWSEANGGLGIRRFEYASGIKELVHVAALPRVKEVLPNGGPDSTLEQSLEGIVPSDTL